MNFNASRTVLAFLLAGLGSLSGACRATEAGEAPRTSVKPAASAAPDRSPDLSPEGVLDDWHAAAAEADEARYLGHFTPDAIFLGTDATERWTLAEFSDYVRTYFPRGGWTYLPHDRNVIRSEDGTIAWFDEGLSHGAYGELRGTGVLRLVDGRWRLAHYSMAFTVPNEVAAEVVRVVAEGAE